jgi:hypothetical protein
LLLLRAAVIMRAYEYRNVITTSLVASK